MFIMILYVLSGLSIPIENPRFLIPICMFSTNIQIHRLEFNSVADILGYLLHRLEFNSVADVLGYLQNAGHGLEPNLGTKVDGDNHKATICI